MVRKWFVFITEFSFFLFGRYRWWGALLVTATRPFLYCSKFLEDHLTVATAVLYSTMMKRQVKNSQQVEALCRALKIIKQSHRSFHVAAIFKGSKLISYAANTVTKTHPVAKKFGYKYYEEGLHAELAVVIRSGLENLADYEIYICRIDNNRNLACSAPCIYCRKMLEMLNVKKCFYSTNHNDWKSL